MRVKYKINKYTCLTKCPNIKNLLVGSSGCEHCVYFGINIRSAKTIICNYKPDQADKQIIQGDE